MDDAIGGIVGLFFLFIVFAFIITLVAGWELLKLGWQFLVWLYEEMKPHIIEVWESWKRSRLKARKPDDIQIIGMAARDEIDQIMTRYRHQVDTILQTEGISPETLPEVVILSNKNYQIHTEDTYVS